MGLVGTDLVVVAGEKFDAALEGVEGIELIVGTEPLLEGLVVALDLALGLGRRLGLPCLKLMPSAARSISRPVAAPR